MTDYYPLIARAVAGLEKSTGESRRALYERARTALVAQLRGLDPPLSEAEITHERLGLEEAIRKVEGEAARRPRPDAPRADPAPTPKRDGDPSAETPSPPPERRPPDAREPATARPPPSSPPGDPTQPRSAGRRRLLGERPPISDQGLKGFRDVVAEAETLGEATAQAAKSARQAYAAVPANDPNLDKIEPRVEPPGLRTPVRERPRPNEPTLRPPEPGARPTEPVPRPPEPSLRTEPKLRPPQAPPRADPSARALEPSPRSPEPSPRSLEPPQRQEPRPSPPRPLPSRQLAADEPEHRPPRSFRGIISLVLAVLILAALGGGAYWLWSQGYFGSARTPPTPATQRDSANGPTRPKIPDRVGQSGQQAPTTAPGSPATAAVAQRVVLYEEDPADAQGKRYLGSVIWRTETVSPGPGLAPELAVRADLEIPERRVTMTMSLRRNTDQALPASHTIEVMFNLPADFPFGGISNVPGILMKSGETTRGAPLNGLAVKVTSGFFLVGLSAVESEMQRNIQLLKERPWFDIPIVYNNGRRAILAVEKGTPGERAFTEAFAAWGQ